MKIEMRRYMKDFFTGNKIKIFLHFLAWIILLGLPLYTMKRWDVGKDFIWLYYINTIISGIIFYINYIFLAPGFFFNNRKYRYYISVILMLIILYFVSDKSNEMVFTYIPGYGHKEETMIKPDDKKMMDHAKPGPMFVRPPFKQMHVFNYIFTSSFLVFFSLGLRVLERYSLTEKLQKDLEKEKLNSELAFLKNQISPHFFFNTLNNIYSLISINTEDSQKAVLKLSKLMRYLLYESEHGNTTLGNELDFMNNYIDLMRLRMNEKVILAVSFPSGFKDINIPPLIFIPFIENAFKHGISYREKSFIDISMTTLEDSISFRCTNSLVKAKEGNDSQYSGIGLENVRKRLNLLFPGQHELKISNTDTEFEVLLTINFS
jgi:two-component system, LytTR family, sensor kinase